MYINGNMVSVETIPGLGVERGIKENGQKTHEKMLTISSNKGNAN
jgi:hypothetical protein